MGSKKLLVLGAGSSRALHSNFGLGIDLVKDIRDRVTDATTHEGAYLSSHLEKLKFDIQLRQRFHISLREYVERNHHYGSIDAFIDEVNMFPEFINDRQQFKDIAKHLIFAHILGYEGLIVNGIEESRNWINVLAKFLNDQKCFSDQSRAPHIVTFNYDRCIEQGLYSSRFLSGHKVGVKQFSKNNIHHVYGKIGALEWENDQEFFEFGEGNNNYQKIYDNRDALQLIFEERANNPGQRKIEDLIHSTQNRIVAFFGFGFDLANCGRLSLQRLAQSNPSARFIANVFPHHKLETRQLEVRRIREIRHDAEITCMESHAFFTHVLGL